MSESTMRVLKTNSKINIEEFKIFLPDCGLFEAKSEADIDCNGNGGWWDDGWDVVGIVGGAGTGCSTGVSILCICKMYESARISITYFKRNSHNQRFYIPVGTGVHDISRLPIPALSNCTFSGSPGIAVSKHHRSLQHTWNNRFYFYWKRSVSTHLIVPCFSISISSTPNIHSRIHGYCTMASTRSWYIIFETFLSKKFPRICFYNRTTVSFQHTIISVLPRLNAANVFVHFHSFSFG